MVMANTQAYFNMARITAVKKFYLTGSWGQC